MSNNNINVKKSNKLRKIFNSNGTETWVRTNFIRSEKKRIKYVSAEINHNLNIIKFAARIKNIEENVTKDFCNNQLEDRFEHKPVQIFSKTLCNLVRNLQKNDSINSINLFNDCIINLMHYYGVEHTCVYLSNDDAEKIIKKAKKTLEKRVNKLHDNNTVDSNVNIFSELNNDNIDELNNNYSRELSSNIIDEFNNNIRESDSNIKININLDEEKICETSEINILDNKAINNNKQELKKQIKKFCNEKKLLEQKHLGLRKTVNIFDKTVNKINYLVQNKNDGFVNILVNQNYEKKSFPNFLQKYISGVKYLICKNRKREEYRIIAYTLDTNFDILSYGGSVFRQTPEKNIIYSEERGKAIALLRLIKTPVIISNFIASHFGDVTLNPKLAQSKKNKKYIKNNRVKEAKKAKENFNKLDNVEIEENIKSILLKYLYSKQFGCSNRASNSAECIKELNKVIKAKNIHNKNMHKKNLEVGKFPRTLKKGGVYKNLKDDTLQKIETITINKFTNPTSRKRMSDLNLSSHRDSKLVDATQ